MARRKKTSRQNKRRAKFSQALQRLKKLNAREQHLAIGAANNNFIRQFCKELKKLKHAKLPPKGRKVLQRHKKQLRLLIHPKTAMTRRRRMLSQKGGSLLKTVLRYVPLVGPLVDLFG